ncbi:MAG: cytochrome c [Burkholderiaceae bacterium]
MKSLALLATAGLLVASGVVHAQASADEIERGHQLFMTNGCYSCHGTVGQGGERSGAPKLAPDTYPFEAFQALVRTPREAMPRFDRRYVSDEQLRSIHTYLSSIPKGLSAKEIAALR